MIYENIKKYCVKCNISISELERRANLGNGTIGKWKTITPKADNLKAVADILKVKVDTLFK